MRRLWWWAGAAGAVAVAAAGVLAGTGFPGRSSFVAEQQPRTCELFVQDRLQPFGAVHSCTMLGRRTPLFGGPDGSVFVLLECGTGPVAARVDYRRTGDGFTADAVEVPVHLTPGINAEPTGKRLNEAVGQRGGLRTEPWRLHPAAGEPK